MSNSKQLLPTSSSSLASGEITDSSLSLSFRFFSLTVEFVYTVFEARGVTSMEVTPLPEGRTATGGVGAVEGGPFFDTADPDADALPR